MVNRSPCPDPNDACCCTLYVDRENGRCESPYCTAQTLLRCCKAALWHSAQRARLKRFCYRVESIFWFLPLQVIYSTWRSQRFSWAYRGCLMNCYFCSKCIYFSIHIKLLSFSSELLFLCLQWILYRKAVAFARSAACSASALMRDKAVALALLWLCLPLHVLFLWESLLATLATLPLGCTSSSTSSSLSLSPTWTKFVFNHDSTSAMNPF